MQKNHFSLFVAPLLIILLGAALVLIFASKVDVFEAIFRFTRDHEDFELDELFSLALYLWFAFGVVSFIWALRLLQAKNDLTRSNEYLKDALDQIKTLEGLLPICANCKKIRTENSSWQHLETYISQHSAAKFTHSLCPDCVKELYPELNLDDEQSGAVRP